jgi:hypothetical protein
MEGVNPGIDQIRDRMARFLHEPGDPTGRVQFHDASGRGVHRVEHGQGRDRAVAQVRVDERPQVEIREVVGVADQEELFAVHPPPVGGQRTRAAEKFGLVEHADRRRPLMCGKVAAYDVR